MNVICPAGGTGLTSELSVRLHHVALYHRQHGKLPDAIDGSKQFWLYRDRDGQNVSWHLFDSVRGEVECERSEYNHGWQSMWYDEIKVADLYPMVKATCWPSGAVAYQSKIFYDKLCGRTAVVYRGNDKEKEIPRVSYETMAEMARDSGSKSFIVQTDEADFYEFFSKEFPDTVRFENFPMIRRNREKYVIAEKGDRVRFAVEFYAAVIALAKASKLIVVTGNVGIWCVLWRGNTKDVWQAHGVEQKWRRLRE